MVHEKPSNIKDFRNPVARIYPNPADDILNIEVCYAGTQVLEIEILTVTGQIIYQKKYRNIDVHFTEKIDMINYINGIYFVKIKQSDSVYTGKVVVR
jgi:hypothetical protein